MIGIHVFKCTIKENGIAVHRFQLLFYFVRRLWWQNVEIICRHGCYKRQHLIPVTVYSLSNEPPVCCWVEPPYFNGAELFGAPVAPEYHKAEAYQATWIKGLPQSSKYGLNLSTNSPGLVHMSLPCSNVWLSLRLPHLQEPPLHPCNEDILPVGRLMADGEVYLTNPEPPDSSGNFTQNLLLSFLSFFCTGRRVHSPCEWVRKIQFQKAMGFEMGSKLHQGDAGLVKRPLRKKVSSFQHNRGHCCYLCCYSCFYNWFAPPAQWPGNNEKPVSPVPLCGTLMRSSAQGGRSYGSSVHTEKGGQEVEVQYRQSKFLKIWLKQKRCTFKR